jgi:hypothetical protein
MEATAQASQPDDAALHRPGFQETELFHVPLRASDAARSAKNISLWNSYLPAACVRTMVRKGWDYTT